MDVTRRSFVKGISAILGGYAVSKILPIAEAQEVKDALNEFPKYSANPQPMPILGDGYRWVSKEMLEKRLQGGYRFVGVRPIVYGGEMVLMKKVIPCQTK